MNSSMKYIVAIIIPAALLLIVLGALRFYLFVLNHDLVIDVSATDILAAFTMGARFDLKMIAYAILPLTFLSLIRGPSFKIFCLSWFTGLASLFILLALIELEFYGEFQQRLNYLVVQYINEDSETVLGMVWRGYPVLAYLAVWITLTLSLYFMAKHIVNQTVPNLTVLPSILIAMILLTADIFMARGTFRSGPPLRWGDAYLTDNLFLNQAGLNGSFTLGKALLDANKNESSKWLAPELAESQLATTRELVLTNDEKLVHPLSTALQRTTPGHPDDNQRPNIVIILMESFSGQYTGALTGGDVTPNFDKLAAKGLLMTRAFSNGTHTHQGIFATLSCFPNLPGYEYLMQSSHGSNQFSGISVLLPDRPSVFVYNGDFNWDNQYGFFRNQGVDKFVGRYDYVSPVYMNPVWGASDEDMFNRAIDELDELKSETPFLAILQTLSNHVPYDYPKHPEIAPVNDETEMNDRLNAMKYSDWALGKFFDAIEEKPYFDNTIFVVLGDHGFGTTTQLTEINLLRFHVPILFIGPGIRPNRNDVVMSQVDVIPSLLGMAGISTINQCWGRDISRLPPDDKGFAIIKPSGSEPTVAIIKDDLIVTTDDLRGSHLYRYLLQPKPVALPLIDPATMNDLSSQLSAYIATALTSLADNSTQAGG
jgi:phosphoglycerol transferase MdoB-like AlkP superfamily enzyme